jgi:hypothetical protein
VAAFLPWQQLLVSLAQQLLRGEEPSLAQLVSLCLWPAVQQFTTYRVGSKAQPPLLLASMKELHRQREDYTRSVWAARMLLASVWHTLGSMCSGQEQASLPITRAVGEGVARDGGCSCYSPLMHEGMWTAMAGWVLFRGALRLLHVVSKGGGDIMAYLQLLLAYLLQLGCHGCLQIAATHEYNQVVPPDSDLWLQAPSWWG